MTKSDNNAPEIQNPDRRKFMGGLVAGTALALAGCQQTNPGPAVTKIAEDNLHFVDSTGKQVNMAGLKAQLNGKPFTMSLMFAGCGDICPTTATHLKSYSNQYPSLKHVVVSVQPGVDYPGGLMEKVLSARGLKVDGSDRNTIVLFPTTSATDIPSPEIMATPQTSEAREKVGKADMAFLEGQEAALAIQERLNMPYLEERRLENHVGTIMLYGNDGRVFVDQYGHPYDIKRVLPQLEEQIKQAGISR